MWEDTQRHRTVIVLGSKYKASTQRKLDILKIIIEGKWQSSPLHSCLT